MSKFSERLRELREERGLSQNELAKELKTSAACISRWEKDLRIPNIESIVSICKYFGCSADFLIGLED